jgi:hypothetical protein
VFEVGLINNGKLFRTPFIHKALMHNYNKVKEKGLLLIEQPEGLLTNLEGCTESGNWFEPLGRFIETLLFVNRFKLAVLEC